MKNKNCQCKKPDINGNQEDGFWCDICLKPIKMPDYDPTDDEHDDQYREELGNNGEPIDNRIVYEDDTGVGGIAGYRGGDKK